MLTWFVGVKAQVEFFCQWSIKGNKWEETCSKVGEISSNKAGEIKEEIRVGEVIKVIKAGEIKEETRVGEVIKVIKAGEETKEETRVGEEIKVIKAGEEIIWDQGQIKDGTIIWDQTQTKDGEIMAETITDGEIKTVGDFIKFRYIIVNLFILMLNHTSSEKQN
jgi:hypothetical protein